MLGDYRSIDNYLAQIEKVTAADIQRVAKKYLVDSNRTVGVLVPTGVLRHEVAGGGAGGAVHHANGSTTSRNRLRGLTDRASG